uniref:Putative secreted protein n=1 Tax=Anopheles darlingi TaxID=43151 RepID=A0A2M4DEY9_ANODA
MRRLLLLLLLPLTPWWWSRGKIQTASRFSIQLRSSVRWKPIFLSNLAASCPTRSRDNRMDICNPLRWRYSFFVKELFRLG